MGKVEMYLEVQKRVLTLTDNRYLSCYLTSMNCVRGKEHNMYLNSYLTSMNCVRGKEHNKYSKRWYPEKIGPPRMAGVHNFLSGPRNHQCSSIAYRSSRRLHILWGQAGPIYETKNPMFGIRYRATWH